MKISFYKMHGAGNDFVVVDDRDGRFPSADRALLRFLGRRRTGVGCEGILLLQRPQAGGDVRMRFFNPDGSEQAMCGNGARCLARLAFELGAAPRRMVLETAAGPVRAEVEEGGGRVRLWLTAPRGYRPDLEPEAGLRADFVNTGVEHLVVRVERLAGLDVDGLGRRLREHPLFAPAGTNVNFVAPRADGSLDLRTYERGVEAETLACGTGAAAAAFTAEKRGWTRLPVVVHCPGGDLEIGRDGDRLTLLGGAEHVYRGELEYGDRL